MKKILLNIIYLYLRLAAAAYCQEIPIFPSHELEKYPLHTQLHKALQKPNEVLRLDLSQQQLKKIPPEVFLFPNLQELNLSENQISELPPTISQLKNLRYLNLYKNKLRTIPAEIVELRKLEVLLLGKNRIELLPSSIRGLKKLVYLDVSGNNLSTYEIDYLYKHLPNCTIRH
ncbi:MAG: leucine-rich repeat domain-containing protein [Bacteroidia bacterium]|nr:leucine-rich repeat domain-containing protein [Bacteroidia bacterium]MDW8159440.1 leucine-rich repeat domain-containing protein [Bacteroidia bacterium]